MAETDDVFEEFDELAGSVTLARYRFFSQNLRRWFHLLDTAPAAISARVAGMERRVPWDQWESRVLAPPTGMVGSGEIKWPDDQEQRLGLQLQLFRRIASETLDAVDFAHNYFYVKNGNFDEILRELTSQVFEPFIRELRRYLLRNRARPIADDEELGAELALPASDRTVTLDHNQPEYTVAVDALDSAERAVQESNDYDDVDDKEQRMAEINAGRQLLRATRARADALIAVIYRSLKYLAVKFVDLAIGRAASAALTLIGKITGLW